MQKIDRGEVELISPEMNMRLNTDKQVMFDNLLGLNKMSYGSQTSLPFLFDKYFKGNVNKEFTSDDLKDLSEQIKTMPKQKPLFTKVNKGHYIDGEKGKKSHIFFFMNSKENKPESFPECLIGSSSVDNALWFHFSNEIEDVCGGSIYWRTSPLRKLTKLSTFEINPFIASKHLHENSVLANYSEKPQLTFNPNWLVHTLDNMEKQIFAKLNA